MAVVPSFDIIDSKKDHSGAESMNVTKYTSNPLMLICPRKIESERTFVIDVRSTEPSFIVEDPLLVWALTALPKEFLREEAVAVWTREERVRENVDEIWDFVTAEGLVVPVDELQHLQDRYKSWSKDSWDDAVVYHEGTRDYPFVDMNRKDAFLSDNKRMKEYEDAWPAPKVYQSFKSIESIPLQKVTEEFAGYLAERSAHDAMKDLSLIFDFCFGERFRLDHAYDEQNFLQLESLRKAIPSGGGRHPTELFFVVFDESLGLSQGLYHYNVQNNALDLLRRGDHFVDLQSSLGVPLKTNGSERPQAILLFTSLCERAMWRYRDPRSWRAFIIDVGHAEYMCRQVCASLDYSLSACHKFDAAGGAAFLGLDQFRQPLLSVAALERNR